MRLIAFGVLLSAIVTPAWAVNKCAVGGKTVYQDAPCAGGEKLNLSGAGSSSADVAAARGGAAAMCEAALRKAPAWKDPGSVQVSGVTRVGFTTKEMHGTTLAVVLYRAEVNARNSYGGYTGNKPAFCYLDGSETRVLDINVH